MKALTPYQYRSERTGKLHDFTNMLELNAIFTCDIINGLSKKIGSETMRKTSTNHALVVATQWLIPANDARRRVYDSTGETVKMLVPNFDPEITV